VSSLVFNADLLGDLARQKVVLFLGAGVSSSAVTAGGGKIAGWATFLSKTAQKVEDPLRAQVIGLIDAKDYLLACELLQSALSDEWEEVVAAEYGQVATPSALHSALLNLRQRIILTTNFDKLLEMAWGQPEQGATHYAKVIARIDQDIFKILKNNESRYLLKIHGSVDDAETLVFSRSEYIRLAFGNENYSSFLENLLLNYTFLFVGFSMDDPAITSLMEMYAFRYPKSRPHYIFTPAGVPENILEVYKRLRKLSVIQYDPADNHAALTPLISELGNQARERQRTLISDAMTELEAFSTPTAGSDIPAHQLHSHEPAKA
jgi:NAD-dependent SIR2 family protein deacetylase